MTERCKKGKDVRRDKKTDKAVVASASPRDKEHSQAVSIFSHLNVWQC